MPHDDPRRRAGDYLRTAHLYHLGVLPTEQPHSDTRNLSRLAAADLRAAVRLLKRIDLDALTRMRRCSGAIERLGRAVARTLDAGRRVFLAGCGATGRLSLSLEAIWREAHPGSGQVLSLMAGGDVALVHALEGFEDHPDRGAHHLRAMGFTEGDLLIACTEGGETPWVIGATEAAATLSSASPWFLYCNRDTILVRHVERFRRIYRDSKIERICLDTGPMALTGSTRMQASTVLQLAVGLALLHRSEPAGDLIGRYRDRLDRTDYSFLTGLIERESSCYASGHDVIYRVRDYGITVLTDTTERAPTFSLVPFDQLKEPLAQHSLCYVALDDAADATAAWRLLLNRAPRPLDRPDLDLRTTAQYLNDFDFSIGAVARRRSRIPGREQRSFRIHGTDHGIAFRMQDLNHVVPVSDLPPLLRHLTLKQMLNIHSTLVMGRLGRYEGNLMTWVTPTNGKLIDRAARYVMHLLEGAGHPKRYEEIVFRLFEEMERTPPGDSVVLATCRSLLARRAAS